MARILVVDDDQEIRELAQLYLTDLGHEVLAAADGAAGLDVATREKPELIITDVLMPGMDGWAVVRALRSNAETALIPVIFLTALSGRADRLRGFRLGADDYLPKPFEPQELGYRVRRVLASGAEIGTEAKALIDPDLEGRLERIGLSSLLMMLEMERKSGRLRLTTRAETCEIRLRNGHVVDAAVAEPELHGAEAVFHALEWSAGGFGFREEPIEVEDTVGLSTMHLLMEGARRIDELSAPSR